MEREKIIQMFKNENLSKKAGCGCKKKKFAEEEQSKVVKEGFPIPSPESDEDVDAFISRCMGDIGKEYPEDQALAICNDKWENK